MAQPTMIAPIVPPIWNIAIALGANHFNVSIGPGGKTTSRVIVTPLWLQRSASCPAVVAERDGPLAFGCPHPADDRLQPDAVLIRGRLNRLVRALCRFLGNDQGQLLWNGPPLPSRSLRLSWPGPLPPERLRKTSRMGERTLRRLLIIGASGVVRWARRKGAPAGWREEVEGQVWRRRR